MLFAGGAGAATAVIGRCSGGWDAGSPAYKGVEGAVGRQPVQEDHGFGAVADGVTIPARIVSAEIRYSAATVNSNPASHAPSPGPAGTAPDPSSPRCPPGRSSTLDTRPPAAHDPTGCARAAHTPPAPAAPPAGPRLPAVPPAPYRARTPATATSPAQWQARACQPAPAPARIEERDVCGRQREVPDQIIPADAGGRPQPLQLILSKHPVGTGLPT